jgi:hypothetical protein
MNTIYYVHTPYLGGVWVEVDKDDFELISDKNPDVTVQVNKESDGTVTKWASSRY